MKKFYKKVTHRIELLILTSISKKTFWAIVSTALLVTKHLDPATWSLLIGAIIGINSFEKVKGVKPNLLVESDTNDESKYVV